MFLWFYFFWCVCLCVQQGLLTGVRKSEGRRWDCLGRARHILNSTVLGSIILSFTNHWFILSLFLSLLFILLLFGPSTFNGAPCNRTLTCSPSFRIGSPVYLFRQWRRRCGYNLTILGRGDRGRRYSYRLLVHLSRATVQGGKKINISDTIRHKYCYKSVVFEQSALP